METLAMIHVDAISKKFGKQVVLDRLSVDIAEGETFALLGPNGAGKSTLLKCIVGLYSPIEGSVTIDGLSRSRDHLAICRFTSWLPDQPFAYPTFTGRLWLETIADIYGVEPKKRDEQIDELLALFALTE